MSLSSTGCSFSLKRAILISVEIIDHVTAINCLFSFIQRGHTSHCSNCRLLLSTVYPILFKRTINIFVAYYSYYIDHATCINCLLNFIPESLKLEDIAGGWPVWSSLQYSYQIYQILIRCSASVRRWELKGTVQSCLQNCKTVLRNVLYDILIEFNKSMKLYAFKWNQRQSHGMWKYLSHSYPSQNDQKQGDALSRRTFSCVVGYAIMKVQKYRGGGGRLVYVYKWHKHTICIRCQREGWSINRRRQNLVIMCSLSHHKCTDQNCNTKLHESVEVMEIRGSEGGDYEYFVWGRVPEVQGSNTWERG
jgi:hypothetical protein